MYLKKTNLIIVYWLWVVLVGQVWAQNVDHGKVVMHQADIQPTRAIETQLKKTDSYEFVAIVNEQPISQSFYEMNLQEWLEQGQKDSDRLRKNLKEELINRELILQEAARRGVNGDINWQEQVHQLKQKLAVQVLTNQYLKDQGVNEKTLLQDYQNQKKQNVQNETLVQYKIKQITVREKSVAIALLGRLQQGESFEVVARGLPVGAGGVTSGWINPNQIPFDVSDAIARLPIGGVVEAPIFTEGAWLIIRLEDKRSGSSLGFEEYKNQVVQLKLRDFYAQLLRQLRSQASIHQ